VQSSQIACPQGMFLFQIVRPDLEKTKNLSALAVQKIVAPADSIWVQIKKPINQWTLYIKKQLAFKYSSYVLREK